MGASTENFCLRWNDFESNVSGSFRELREDSDFFDVTLATSDSGNRTLQAHKVILSACSNFFKQMLRQQTRMHSHPNPLIYLRGVTYSDLLAVLDFMYHGEVNVAQDDLNSFLAVAEELQIKGLTNKEQPEATPSSSNKARPPPVRMKDTGPPPKRVRKSSPGLPVRSSQIAGTSIASGGASVIDDDDEIKEVNVKIDPEVSVLADAEEAVNPDEEGFDESYGDYYGDDGSGGMEGDGTEEDPVAGGTSDGAKDVKFSPSKKKNETIVLQGSMADAIITAADCPPSSGGNDNEDPETQLENMLTQDGPSWICKACGRKGNRRDNMKRHVENLHLPRVLRCKLCQMLVRNRQSFYRHMKNKHGITSMRETEQYKEDPCDPNSTGRRDTMGNPVGSYDDDEYEEEQQGSEFLMSILKVEHSK